MQLKTKKNNVIQRGGNEGGNVVREIFPEETMPDPGETMRGCGSKSRESNCTGKEEQNSLWLTRGGMVSDDLGEVARESLWSLNF